MHNNTHLVVYKGTVYKFKTHRPQYLEITIQSNYRNPYLTIYQKRSKWKHKFKSNSNWLVKNFRNHSNENITYNINKNTFNHTNNNNENDFIKQSTSIINQSLNGLFHVAVLHRDYKRHHHQHFQDYSGHRVWYNSQKDKKWFKSHVVQKSDSHINQSLSEHVNTSHRLIHNHLIDSSNCTNDNQIDSLSDLKSTLKSCLNISPGYKSSDKLTEKYINQMTIKKRNNNNHNSNNDRSLLIGLFMESGKVNIFEFTSISERDLCLTSLQQIISINKQTNAYPDIEFAWSVNVYFKPKDYTSAFLIPNCNGLHYLCLTRTEILLIQKNLRVPKLIILYQFVRQCVSRRDGQFRIYTGRASPTGECEIVFQLTDHIEAAYAHEQCVRLMCQSNENDKPEVGTSSSLSSLSSPLSFPWRTSFRSNRFNHAQNNLPPLPRPVSFPLVESISQPTKRLHYSKSLHNFSNTFDTTYNSQSVVLESIHKSHALHYSWPLLKHLKNHNSVVNLCKMRNIQRVTSDCQKSQYTLQPTAETNNGIKEKLETEHNTTLSTENQNTSLANENEMAFVCDNEKKEDDTPTSHYLEMNLNESELEQDNRLVVLRNQSLLNKRIKAFSACSPPDIMLSNSSTEMSVKIFPNFTQSSSSTSMKERIISNRDNNDIFANLFFEKLSSAQPIKSSVYCSTSSYHANKHDKCTKKPLSYVSLQNSLQSSSLFSSSCQSTSTRSRNSLFNNAYSSIGADVTGNNCYGTTSSSCSILPMTSAVFSGSTLFNANCSSINRPRTSSDVSNMRRSGFCYSGSITQQSQVKQNQPPDNHSYQNRYFHTSNTIGCQLAPNSFSSLKLCRDLTSITESQETVNPVSRPRAATVGCNLLFGRQRLSAALNHIKLNWSKKQSTSQQKCSIHSKNISSDSLTTHNNKSSIHRKSEISRTKHLHMKQVEKEHDDEYVETFEMDMNLFPDNLEHLTCRTEAIPDLSNHYVIL